ncbi:CRISPR-associated protein [Cyanobacterium stanieri LEGE 03274]|uniref:CRISPR-associated protein n=1 Tax=Cyanobacterium stanieri LEGE 03274 TaxID=1828756 RepID=A0ABR9V4K5_9CHRO|nr:type III-B CRISPR module-associated Cmr3 family protein [Cyanobacterium stanieri]MBE9221764.1 CRISPR-associated protein [Cyanobacterium stanieri LEGE 03274]
MFKYLINIKPLGYLYGSAGGFLSPENLVGRSRSKFPPDPATVSGLFFSANKNLAIESQQNLVDKLHIAGPFWAKENNIQDFYIPIPWTKIIDEKESDEWEINEGKWQRKNRELTPAYKWQKISQWNQSAQEIKDNQATETSPWQFVPMLHPKMRLDERHTEEGGLFLENAVQMDDDTSLVYLSTYQLPDGWYRFGGENHLVEINSIPLNTPTQQLFQQPITKAFALISSAVWGSNRLSRRYPEADSFPKIDKILTDRAIPYRYRAGGRMGRGRYAVSAGSVYVLSESLNKSWWDWDEDWFPKEGYSLKRVGSGLCLPLAINGVN